MTSKRSLDGPIPVSASSPFSLWFSRGRPAIQTMALRVHLPRNPRNHGIQGGWSASPRVHRRPHMVRITFLILLGCFSQRLAHACASASHHARPSAELAARRLTGPRHARGRPRHRGSDQARAGKHLARGAPADRTEACPQRTAAPAARAVAPGQVLSLRRAGRQGRGTHAAHRGTTALTSRAPTSSRLAARRPTGRGHARSAPRHTGSDQARAGEHSARGAPADRVRAPTQHRAAPGARAASRRQAPSLRRGGRPLRGRHGHGEPDPPRAGKSFYFCVLFLPASLGARKLCLYRHADRPGSASRHFRGVVTRSPRVRRFPASLPGTG